VKLLLNEPAAEQVRTLWSEADSVLSAAIAELEARAAIARRLSSRPAVIARSELAARWSEMEIVPLGEPLLAAAGDTADAHRLRALDAVHLAAALSLRDPTVVFATWDGELAHAARGAGFATIPA
jgi:predicted nucleic acid-binding protein